MNEIVLAIINGNPTICVLLSAKSENGNPKVRIGTNKELKIHSSKIVERSGVDAQTANEIQIVAKDIKEITSNIELEDVWRTASETHSSLTAKEISALLFDKSLDYKNTFAVWMKALTEQIYFKIKKQDFIVNDKETVQRILSTKKKKQRENDELEELAESFNSGKLHKNLSKRQLELIEGLKKLAIYGSKSDKSPILLRFIEQLKIHKNPDKRRTAFDNLANVGILSHNEPTELIKSDIPRIFPEEINADLQGINSSERVFEHRLDLTMLESFTIDDETTQDRDDAFSVDKDTIWIHITDMASIIKDHPIVDAEAKNRAASLYLPELKIPMLPKVISEKIGSLNPGENRPCLSLKLSMDTDGNVREFNFQETVIRTTESFSYRQVDEILSNNDSNHLESLVKVQAISEKFRKERVSNGAISLDRPEMNIELNEHMDVKVSLIEKESESRAIIENLMILYNCFAGKFCEENKVPVAFRLQSRPDIPSGHKIPSGQLGWYTLSKMLRPARLSLSPGRHHGLGVDNYVQVTSPLRRYNDLVTQKQLKNAVLGLKSPYPAEEILNISMSAQKKIRALHSIENARKKYWFLKFLEFEKTQRRNLYRAVVLDNSRTSSRNSLIELEKYPFKGRCWVPDHVTPGSTINVEVADVDLWVKSADFRMCKS